MTLDAVARLDIMPLFVRAGAIIPMMKESRRIPEGLIDPLELALFPDPSRPSSYALLEEEGRTSFRLEPAKRGAILSWSGGVPRSLVIRAGRGNDKLAIMRPGSRSGRVRIPFRPAGRGVTSS
jgi:hypothetical protein